MFQPVVPTVVPINDQMMKFITIFIYGLQLSVFIGLLTNYMDNPFCLQVYGIHISPSVADNQPVPAAVEFHFCNKHILHIPFQITFVPDFIDHQAPEFFISAGSPGFNITAVLFEALFKSPMDNHIFDAPENNWLNPPGAPAFCYDGSN